MAEMAAARKMLYDMLFLWLEVAQLKSVLKEQKSEPGQDVLEVWERPYLLPVCVEAIVVEGHGAMLALDGRVNSCLTVYDFSEK